MQNRAFSVLAGTILISALAACSQGRDIGQTFCTAGDTQTCACGALTGTATCTADGSSFGECVCDAQPGCDGGDCGLDGGPADAGSQLCTPSSTESCTCSDNRPGTATCDGSGNGWGMCICESDPLCTTSSLVANGSATFTGGGIDYTSTPVTTSFSHHLGSGDGCLGTAHFEFALDSGECRLTLDFGAVEDGFGGLTQASLDVDSACSDLTGLAVGTYSGAAGYGLVSLNMTTAVPDAFTNTFCLQDEFISFGSGSINLTTSGGTTLTMSLGTLQLTGDLFTSGSFSAACYSTAMCGPDYRPIGSGWCKPVFCANGQHDGGDGTCVANGTCVSGYHDGGNGSCVFIGSCVSGYRDGGNGTCVLNGSCAVGFHDGGDGLCAPAGTCDFGYHDGGNGTCVAEGSCSSGYTPDNQGGCFPTGDCTSAPAVANAGMDRTAGVGSLVTLNGATSRGATPLAYFWSLSAPTGSIAQLSASNGPAVTFRPDIEGDYQAQLSITDGRNCFSAPSLVTIHAVVRPPSIVVRVNWDADKGDLDLHYLAPGGTFEAQTLDCHYADPSPDWGPNGTGDGLAGNNPTFGGDQPSGQSADQRWGGSVGESTAHPVSTVVPQLFDGVFTPEVHYFCASQTGGVSQGNVTATIHVLVDGSEVYTNSLSIAQNTVWPAAQITVSGGGTVVNVSASPLSTSTYQGCN